MAKRWKCAHCSTQNADTTLTCSGCGRIQGSVVVRSTTVADVSNAPVPGWPSTTPPPAPNMVSVASSAPGGPTSYWVAAEGKKAGGESLISRIAGAIGLIFLPIAIVAWIVSVVFGADGGSTGTIDPPVDEWASELRPGDCFDFKESNFESVDNVTTHPCGEAHAYEVSHVVTMPAGAFPGDAVVEAVAEDECFSTFGEYVGSAYLETALGVSWVYPSEDAWDAGDRTIQCFVFDPTNDRLTQSVKGSQR